MLTYAFEWRHPGVEAESEQAKELRDKHIKVSLTSTLCIIETAMISKRAEGTVEGTIATIRKLVKEGEL
jgi:hypothetical protein